MLTAVPTRDATSDPDLADANDRPPNRGRVGPRSTGLIRLATIAGVVALFADLAVGIIVADAARDDLLRARSTIHQTIVDEFVAQGLLPLDGSAAAFEALDMAVELRLLGGEAVRVKLWTADGTVVYSDADEIIGQSFELGDNVAAAMRGTPGLEVDELTQDENQTEQRLGSLIEYYLPVEVDGMVVGVFEIYEESSAFTASLDEIRGHVWTAVAIGVIAIALSLGSVTIAWAMSNDRKRRQAESLLGEVLTASDDERRRVVGALHDDIGQPLYRVLYGLEGCRSRLSGQEVIGEIETLQGLIRQIDSALRTELRSLYAGLVEGDDLRRALDRLAEANRSESGLDVHVEGEIEGIELSSAAATTLFRAAQEAVINVRKHARASTVWIHVQADGGLATVTVEDDGRGWNDRDGMGLTTTRQRLAAIGGTLTVHHRRAGGTRFVAAVPGAPA